MQGDQIIMNEAFLKYLSAPTITSGGNPPAFSLTPDGKLTAKMRISAAILTLCLARLPEKSMPPPVSFLA